MCFSIILPHFHAMSTFVQYERELNKPSTLYAITLLPVAFFTDVI
ncbi:hypothetical protein VCRA2119O48_20084 [Vibrio crassostreae]|nr:hypothetical protein VCRA2119O48_20084 [Vibrio crassostreae]